MNFATKIDRAHLSQDEIENEKGFLAIVEGYSELAKRFIYTDIVTTPGVTREEKVQKIVQMLLSKIIMRSLYLNEALIIQYNSNNIFGLFSVLKSFLEIPAKLGYLLNLLNSETTEENMFNSLRKLHLGERGERSMRVGNVDAISVLTMFDKMKIAIDKIDPSHKGQSASEGNAGEVVADFYDTVCNSGHPNFSAYHFIGYIPINNHDTYSLYKSDEYLAKIHSESGLYQPAWDVAILVIRLLSEHIINHHMINNFSDLKNTKFFQE